MKNHIRFRVLISGTLMLMNTYIVFSFDTDASKDGYKIQILPVKISSNKNQAENSFSAVIENRLQQKFKGVIKKYSEKEHSPDVDYDIVTTIDNADKERILIMKALNNEKKSIEFSFYHKDKWILFEPSLTKTLNVVADSMSDYLNLIYAADQCIKIIEELRVAVNKGIENNHGFTYFNEIYPNSFLKFGDFSLFFIELHLHFDSKAFEKNYSMKEMIQKIVTFNSEFRNKSVLLETISINEINENSDFRVSLGELTTHGIYAKNAIKYLVELLLKKN